LLFLLALLGGIVEATGLPPGGPAKETAGPRYDDKGELKRPVDYQTWVFVGANLGLQYRRPAKDAKEGPDAKKAPAKRPQTFHNVYINPEAYHAYAKTGKFPDRTILVMEVYEALDREPRDIVTGGLFPGKLQSVEAAVKNTKRPDGSKTDWAYYAFTPKQATAKAFPDANCYQCHLKHADDDSVWVQFYPTLRSHKKTAAEGPADGH